MSSYCWHLKVAEILILIPPHLCNVSLRDPAMGSDSSPCSWRCGMSRQWHLCGFSEYPYITISAVTAKLCLALPTFPGIKREAQATTNTLHHSSHPEWSRCLSNLGTFTVNALRQNIQPTHLSLLMVFCVYPEEWVIFSHAACQYCKGGHLKGIIELKSACVPRFMHRFYFCNPNGRMNQTKIRSTQWKDIIQPVKARAQWGLCHCMHEVQILRLYWCVMEELQSENIGVCAAVAQVLSLEQWLLLIYRHTGTKYTWQQCPGVYRGAPTGHWGCDHHLILWSSMYYQFCCSIEGFSTACQQMLAMTQGGCFPSPVKNTIWNICIPCVI